MSDTAANTSAAGRSIVIEADPVSGCVLVAIRQFGTRTAQADGAGSSSGIWTIYPTTTPPSMTNS